MRTYLRNLLVAVWFLISATSAFGAAIVFTANNPVDNPATRASWLTAIGATPTYVVDFESGFVNGQNVDSVLFAGGFFINDTSASNLIRIQCGAGSIGGSNPIGNCAAAHGEQPFMFLDFSANPVAYVAFIHIDAVAAANASIITFVGGGTQTFTLPSTGAGGDSGEFQGIFANDMPRIVSVRFGDQAGDGEMGVDNIEYGGQAAASSPEPSTVVMLGAGLLLVVLGRRQRLRRVTAEAANRSW